MDEEMRSPASTGSDRSQADRSRDDLSVIVAGSRSIRDCLSAAGQRRIVAEAIAESGFPVREVVSGTARGVDQLGEEWAAKHDVPVERFPADWDQHGRSAGYVRNEEMAAYADALVAVHVNDSAGTGHMVDIGRDVLGRDRVHRVPVTSSE
jgi:hypothetical protein